MLLICAVFSLLFDFNVKAADKSFSDLSRQLFSDSKESISAKSELLKLKGLDAEIKKAIENGGQNGILALRTLSELKREPLVPWLIEKTRTITSSDELATPYVITLVSMSSGKHQELITKFLDHYIDLKSEKIPASTRLSVLSAWQIQSRTPTLELIQALIEDENYEIRLRSMEVLEGGYRGESAKLVPVLKKALTLSPYPLRIRAAHMALMLSPVERFQLQSELKKCSQDEREEVRAACKSTLESK